MTADELRQALAAAEDPVTVVKAYTAEKLRSAADLVTKDYQGRNAIRRMADDLAS